MYKRILVILLLTLPVCVSAKAKGHQIKTGSDLQHWCEKRSAKYLKAKKLQFYNWTASTVNTNNVYETRGEWRTREHNFRFRCQAKKGTSKPTFIVGEE
ncbi:MAG: hypothetical protein OEZ39_19355 [Gammaproteobacteria bacterium]|nr:hypothetical protein [Gammaproteobacteria bacterium]MDH5654023.1 hypothetical protein [Gammaproteobacteria bacterium]